MHILSPKFHEMNLGLEIGSHKLDGTYPRLDEASNLNSTIPGIEIDKSSCFEAYIECLWSYVALG